MFATLLKYEFRRTKNILLPMNLGALAIGGVGYFVMLIFTMLMQNPDSEIFIVAPLLYLLWMGLILMLALLSTAVTIVLCIQFYREKFTDQGYLTFTLPASTHQILLSSYLNFLIWMIINTIVTLVGIGIMLTPIISMVLKRIAEMGLDISYLWALIKENIAQILPSGALFTVSYIMLLISSLFYGVTLPYLAITLASVLVKKMKLLLAVGIGYGMSMVMGVIPSILAIIEGIITGMLMANNDLAVYAPGAISYIITSIFYMAFAIGGYFLMHHLVKKKLNL